LRRRNRGVVVEPDGVSITGANIDPVMVMRRRALRKARGRRRLTVLCSAVALIGLVCLYYAVRASPIFNVQSVAVSGGNAKLDAAIQADAEQAATGKSLLGLDTGSIDNVVQAMPWVRSATVDRDFPNTLRVTVVMYSPAVAVTSAGSTYLVAADGHVIAKTSKPSPHLVAVTLPKTSKLAVGQDSTDRQLVSALWLLHATPTWFRHQFGAITAIQPGAGTLTATVGSKMQLRLGAPSQLDLKMRVVERTLGKLDAQGRRATRYIDVSAPAHPAALAFRN
jgi:cell division protein FtsQ